MTTENNTSKQVTDQRDFNLLNYEHLEVDFIANDIQFQFTFHRDYSDGPEADLYVRNHNSSPSQMLTCKVPIPVKANAKEEELKIQIPEGETVAVKFTFDDQPLFIITHYGADSSIWFESYDLAGVEMAALYIHKPEAGTLQESPKA